MNKIKSEYRKYKIAKILGKDFKNKEFLELMNQIKETVTNPSFKKFKIVGNPNSIFYGLSKSIINIETYKNNNEKFYLSVDKIWVDFEKSQYSDEEIDYVLKLCIKQHFNIQKNIRIFVCNSNIFNGVYNLNDVIEID